MYCRVRKKAFDKNDRGITNDLCTLVSRVASVNPCGAATPLIECCSCSCSSVRVLENSNPPKLLPDEALMKVFLTSGHCVNQVLNHSVQHPRVSDVSALQVRQW